MGVNSALEVLFTTGLAQGGHRLTLGERLEVQAGLGLSVDTQYLRIGAGRRSGSKGRGGLEPYNVPPEAGSIPAWLLTCWSRLGGC